jgi:2-phosphosulfolactate phosphatase
MLVDVALTPRDLADRDLRGHCAVVIDVFRATTSMVLACAAGCAGIIPAETPDDARQRARAAGDGTLMAGERGGDPIAGFDLGNSPREFIRERIGGRTVVLTTTNGTRALLAVRAADVVGVAALVNVEAAASWAARHPRLTVVCAGDSGQLSLEDTVCAGLIVDRVAGLEPTAELTDAATAARATAALYGKRLERLREDSRWGRRLAKGGYAADIAVCLGLDASREVPRMVGDRVVPGVPS